METNQNSNLVPAAAIFLFLCISGLLVGVLQDNELAFLPWAKQAVNPGWIPNDWLLSSPLRSQWLAGTIVGYLVDTLGFLWGSIVARLLCYALLAYGFANLARFLSVPFYYLLPVLFLFVLFGQAIASGEWLIGAAEPKVFAMAMAILGLPYLMRGQYTQAGMFVGLAASFHILVGGYACITAILFAVWQKVAIRQLVYAGVAFGLFGAIGIYHAIIEITNTIGTPEAARLMTHIRLPHHTIPAFFGNKYPFKILILGAFVYFSWRYASVQTRKLLGYAVLTMVPFIIGLIVWPFDEDGVVLKYYPFRYGDVFFPLLVGISGIAVLRDNLPAERFRSFMVTAAIVVAGLELGTFVQSAQNFGAASHKKQAWIDAMQWVRENSERDSLIVAPPAKASFTYFAQRANIVQFKMSPFTLAMYPEWGRRLADVSGLDLPKYGGFDLVPRLNESYYSKSADELNRLMREYGAAFAVSTCSGPSVRTASVYNNGDYCILKRERDASG